MGCSVTYKESAEGKKFKKNLLELGKRAVYVGFNAESGKEEDGTTIAEIAAYNEFGTSTTPARPFMRNTIEHHKEDAKKMFKEAKEQIKQGADAKTILNGIGVTAKGFMQEEILDGQYAPNAPSTIAKKGSDKPLIDTGRMMQSVTYVVR